MDKSSMISLLSSMIYPPSPKHGHRAIALQETLDDMTLDVEPGRELVLDIDPFRGAGDQLQYHE
jgi:hypothetical protein